MNVPCKKLSLKLRELVPAKRLTIRLSIQSTNQCGQPGQTEREFHISRFARDKYLFDDSLFTLSGNVVFANLHSVRRFVQKLNNKRDLVRFPETAVKAGEINAMGLIDEILHYVVEIYREQKNSELNKKALAWLEKDLGVEATNRTLRKFAEDFPQIRVYRREIELDEYFNGITNGVPNREIILEEMLLLWLANANPAFSPYLELFDDSELEYQTAYHKILDSLTEFFDSQPGFGAENQPLIEMLRSPAIAVPHSLFGQLQYILESWSALLGKFLYRLLGGLDLIKEEEKMRFGLGPGPTQVYDFSGYEFEAERFSQDKDWMPRLVVIAKSTLVWLDQLSKKYRAPIQRLDQIPDQELDKLARWGFSGLWLIGVWERSSASKKIKQYCGNPEAESSAYSLYDYVIAPQLGGDDAFFNLKQRCWQRGIRLASDMVPNHTGIYSRWIVEHPDWFIGQSYSPFPSYSFNGANLSNDERVGIYIEDHYYDRSDAAVVFKRVDFRTGDVRYIYHGNDGTSMPWNDTAQLNYLNPEVREAVIRTIIEVARRTPIIRFDAAMTLTKRHYQRLWFPEPGSGGDIPSRSEHAKTKDEFNRKMPEEFWREVVDRVAQEAPDTLLLAEAFWLMEGYFVRTLGMHRVYNSAFMNMLKNEENAKYRSVIKKTLEFNPEILKRYVNFMNNPDEETAVAQFGKDDKYFGVCAMMLTMPGLPMFGHGQIEGFTEKYGMEYSRAYWDEIEDENLIRRHEREIFPLLKKRHLFADVQNFLLYDFFTSQGYLNENVFAYSNRYENQCSLVVYHNKYETASGWIRTSVAFAEKQHQSEIPTLIQKSLGEGLNIKSHEQMFTIFRDLISGLEYIRSSKQLCDQGLYVELGAFKHYVFTDFREIMDNEWHHYAQLNHYLNGRGVPSIDETMKQMFLQPIHRKFEIIMNRATLDKLLTYQENPDATILDEIEQGLFALLQEIQNYTSANGNAAAIASAIRNDIETILRLPSLLKSTAANFNKLKPVMKFISDHIKREPDFWQIIIGWGMANQLGKIISEKDSFEISRSWIDEWLLDKIIDSAFRESGLTPEQLWRALLLIKILISHQNCIETVVTNHKTVSQVAAQLFEDAAVRELLQVNRYQDVLWFNKEAIESLNSWLMTISFIKSALPIPATDSAAAEKIKQIFSVIQSVLSTASKANYQVEKFSELVAL
ncbi:MAG TPA: alpha-amylase [bacterium]|nr:alpha-amylase [bacterium]